MNRRVSLEERRRKPEEAGRRPLAQELARYGGSDIYPLHMPGHKRRLFRDGEGMEALVRAARMDITEIDGFDNLHEPEGILKDGMELAARLYGADRAFYSVNGSTAGILTAVSAAVPEGGRILMARNCHRSAYHAAWLRGLVPAYLYPETLPDIGLAGAVTSAQVEEGLKACPDAAAVLVVSPTYDGVTADIRGIAEAVHKRPGCILIVDAAHGAHFGFHPAFPESPARLGADLTVVSLHKTMPCLTQTALLLARGDRVSPERLRFFDDIYQTSSPSWILMASIDACLELVDRKGSALWDKFFADREDFLNRTEALKGFRAFTAGRMYGAGTAFSMDPCKILLETSKTCLTGKQFYDILLRRYHLQMEMAAGNYVTAIMTCCDGKDGWDRLAAALLELEKEYPYRPLSERAERTPYPELSCACSLKEALEAPKEKVPLGEAAGRVAGAFLNLYPPGIPLAVPGERLSRSAVDLLMGYGRQNLPLMGVDDGAITILK